MTNLLLILLLIVGCDESPKKQQAEHREQPSAKSIIVDYDWCYPDCQDPTAAFKFHAEGTFNYSTIMFGGMSRYGSWSDIGNDKIKLLYDDDGSTNVLNIISNSTFQIGSTIYKKD